MKVLHFADIHARDKDLDEIKKVCSSIIDAAKNEKPDLIVNAGDTFDNQLIKLDSESARYMMWFHSQLQEFCPVVGVLGTHSHDGKAALALKYASVEHNIVISETPEQLLLSDGGISPPHDINQSPLFPVDAVISMMPTPTKQFFQGDGGIRSSDEQIANAVSAIFAGFGAEAAKYDCPHILVGHFQVGGAYISEGQQLIGRDIEISRNQIELGNFDLVALGHIHFHQELFQGCFYSGSAYRQDAGEVEAKGFYIHEIGQTSRFITLPCRNLIKISEDFTNDGDDLREMDSLFYGYEKEEIEGANVSIKLKFWADESNMVNVENIKKFFMSAGANRVDVRCIRGHRGNVRAARVLELSRLRDKVLEQATLRGEQVAESVLIKADSLDQETREQIVNAVANI